jgi:Tol biopolymer transport system component
VSEFKGRPFFAMQLVEGRSLREFSSDEDPSIERILELGIQICEGLQAAHEKGITHRDIKPSNILIDPHGRAKIVDFGLASVIGTDQLTKTGSTLGTIGYMSPEQVRGESVNHRSDLFSLGVVLYELITKQNPFKQDSEAATLQSVLNTEPEPVARYKSGSSDDLQRIIDKALSKNPQLRYQHADDLIADLKRELGSGSSSGRTASIVHIAKTGRTRPFLIIVSVAFIAGVIAILVKYIPDRTETHTVVSQRQVTYYGDVHLSEIAPDGSYFLFSRKSDSDEVLYMQDLSGGGAIELLRWYKLQDVRMSPDGKEIAVAGFPEQASGGTYILARFGGLVRQISARECSDLCIDWSPESPCLAIQESCTETHRDSISIVDLESEEIRNIPICVPFLFCHAVCWLHDGDRLLITTESADERSLWAIDIDGGSPARILDGDTRNIRRSLHPDCVYCLLEKTGSYDLVKMSLDLSGEKKANDPVSLMSGHQMTRFSVSADNRRLLYNKQTGSSNLRLISFGDDLDSATLSTRQLTQGTGSHLWPSISPDGNHIAYCDRDRQVWIMPITGGEARRVSYSGFQHASPAWSPDGQRIATSCTYDNETFIIKINDISGRQPTRLEYAVTGYSGTVAWLHNRALIYYQTGSKNLNILDLNTREITYLLPEDAPGWVFDPVVDHNGERVAVFWNRGAKRGLWVVSLTDSSTSHLYPGWIFPIKWSQGDVAVYAVLPSQSDPNLTLKYVCRIDISSGMVDTVLTLPYNNIVRVSMSPDGRHFVCKAASIQTDLWLAENFDPDVR